MPTEYDPSQAERILAEVKGRLARSAENVVPWFYANMPEYYFRTHDEDEQIRHLHAILSGLVDEEKQAVVLHGDGGTRITHITPGGDMQALVRGLEQVSEQDIRTARIYSSDDQKLRLDTYLIAPQPPARRIDKHFGRALDTIKGYEFLLPEDEDQFVAFLASATEDYVDKFEPNRAIRHFDTWRCIAGTERVHVELEPEVQPGLDRISVAMTNPLRRGLLLQAVKIFRREGVDILRAYGDVFTPMDGAPITVLSFYIKHGSAALQPKSEQWKRLERQLKLVKWFAFHGLERFAEEEGWEIGQVMLMQAACEFAHQFLMRKNIYAYTSDKITRTALRFRNEVTLLMRYFEARFDPAVGDDREERVQEARDAAREALAEISDDIVRDILGYIFRFFRYTQRTNYYVPARFGLSFRLDPEILAPMPASERPFGIYTFHGPYFFGFQVRYRDMARGGVRVVRTRTQEQFELESNRLYEEVTKLAGAQQFKNKDIPEGGSKAVILLGPMGDIDLAVKSMVDSMLDLIVHPMDGESVTLPEVVDYLGREEIIYLGPDENITQDHIVWIVERAKKRGFRYPSAFMSSKPQAGINHKQYGVTSEGVVVFCDELLRMQGIDPHTRPFTVKLTGGPAGDVASNAVKILFREYGDNARIVAMSDGHGACHDPDGLDRAELERLIESDGHASDFDIAKLKGEGAFVAVADTSEGIRLRDELHNKAVADVFIPAGGRPDTINLKNWMRYLRPDGKPSAGSIVEGANIFISHDARAKLEERGVLVIPGPSANKTGVICSSYEILAGLILSEEEFVDLKDEYVPQVLEILRKRARDEAKILLHEHKLAGGRKTITEISFALSKAINDLADTVTGVLEQDVADLAEDEELSRLVLAYCPPALATRYADRILADIPRAHQFALLAAFIASTILYNEGIGWVENLLQVRQARDVVRAYLAEEKHVAALVEAIEGVEMTDREAVADVLRLAGRKHLTMRRLGLE